MITFLVNIFLQVTEKIEINENVKKAEKHTQLRLKYWYLSVKEKQSRERNVNSKFMYYS